MTVSVGQYPLIGVQTISNSSLIGVEIAQSVTGYVPLIPVGTIVTFNDPVFGALEAIRLAIPVSTAVRVGVPSILNNAYTYVPVPNTANLGQSIAICASDVPSNTGFVQYAWFIIAGRFPVFSAASIAADSPLGVVAAGQLGANSAGKQVLNARVQAPATTTVVKAGSQLQNGSPLIRVNNTDGWFVGTALSGTGIPASAAVGAIDASGTVVTMVTAGGVVPLNATATIGTSVTGTYNDATRFWNVITMQRPFVQGAIT